MKNNNFTRVANHYNYNDRFEDEVEDKINICDTFDEEKIC